MSTYNLDFSLTTSQQRTELISQICSTSTFTSKQYTQMADYILLCKDNPRIYPEEFTSPYIIHDEQSLDELMEDPITADLIQSTAIPLTNAKHGTKKRIISRTNSLYSSIPGMSTLWSTIDFYKQQQNLTFKQKKLLIDLYKQQYSLLESYLPTPFQNNTYQKQLFSTSFPSYDDYAEKLCESKYMAIFLTYLPYFSDIQNLDLSLQYIVNLVEKALSLVSLTPLQQDILFLYQKELPAKQILSFIKEKHNKQLGAAYLSVILYNQIGKKVAFEYTELYHQDKYANDPTKWRTCLCCKQSKLLTKHNWHHFSNKPQGFSLICKECTNAAKQKKKEGYAENH